ncbi:MAG TPA: NADH-quinone oxidoreductase subunit F, partial [Candidatus Limnocylindria bacterium]|nr:NADH-quinone oxidoreductase subunit F [Candidatus Limnocylindria bacterium]
MPEQFKLILKDADQPGYTPDIECYLRHGGYEALKKALATPVRELPDNKKMSPQEVVRDEVLKSGLRGRGGAGFSAGLKWSFVDRRSGKPIYLVCNADESEPGTFKDRQIMHKDPHQLIEGMVISCWANDVKLAYLYIRGEMPQGARLLNRALKEARDKGFLGKNILGTGYDLEIYVHRGAGAYICGEETGLIESLEGKRAYPRIKPPYFPAVLGLYMSPTIVNNVETLCHVKHIVNMGSAAYAKLGTPNNTGTRIVSLSGDVKKPGYFEVEVGKVTIGELINHPDFGGGLKDGRTLKAIIPGGSSSKVLKAGEIYK